MSTTRSGDPANITTPLAATVLDATNATPIVIQTTAPHGYGDNDYVEILGVGGNTAANGTWKTTYIDADHFSLDGSVGNGAYTAGGTILDQSLTPTVTRPSDGDLRSAASVNLAIDRLADYTAWLALVRGKARKHSFGSTAGTFKVPTDCTYVDVEIIGGGGGGGGGRGNGSTGDLSAPGGGGVKRVSVRVAVVPGETLTFAPGAGGVGGTGGNNAGAVGTVGAHGGDSTLTGSTSGLLATGIGAQGAMFATAGGWAAGGMPVKWATAVGLRSYPNNSTSLTIAGKFYPTWPLPGQGGHAGASTEILDVMMKWGGGTGYSLGGTSGTVDSTFSGSGGASEWEGGIGGSGSAFNTFVHSVNGGNGVFGSGGGGGTGGFTGFAAGNGGNGGDGACAIRYNSGTKAVTT